MASRDSFEVEMHKPDIEQQRKAVSYLRHFANRFEPKRVAPSVIAHFNQLPQLPAKQSVELDD